MLKMSLRCFLASIVSGEKSPSVILSFSCMMRIIWFFIFFFLNAFKIFSLYLVLSSLISVVPCSFFFVCSAQGLPSFFSVWLRPLPNFGNFQLLFLQKIFLNPILSTHSEIPVACMLDLLVPSHRSQTVHFFQCYFFSCFQMS